MCISMNTSGIALEKANPGRALCTISHALHKEKRLG